MNRIITIAILLLTAGNVSGQTLRMGTVIECNEITVNLKPGGTMEQYSQFMVSQLVPATEKAFPGTEVYIVRGNRGNAESKVGAIWVFETPEIRNRYYDPGGNLTPAGQKASAEVDPVLEQLERIGTGSRKSMVWEVINEPRSEKAAAYYEYLIGYCSRENYREVPVSPSAMGIADPMLGKLVEDLSGAVSELVNSGVSEDNPAYEQYTSKIDFVKKTIREVATRLEEEEKKAFQKGGSFGYHRLTVSLAPEVTMDQFMGFWTEKFIPEFVKLMEGLEVLIMKPFGETLENRFVYVNYFRSESSRDRYWPEPDIPSDRTNAALEEMRPIMFDLVQLGTWEDDYGVWIVQ